MAVFKSDQITKLAAVPSSGTLDVDEGGGRVRAFGFKFTVPVGGVAIADTVQLCKIPAGARILGGVEIHDALAAAGGTIALGDGTTAAKYMAATVVAAAGRTDFANTRALNCREKLAAELTLTATVAVAALLAGAVLEGHVLVQLAD